MRGKPNKSCSCFSSWALAILKKKVLLQIAAPCSSHKVLCSWVHLCSSKKHKYWLEQASCLNVLVCKWCLHVTVCRCKQHPPKQPWQKQLPLHWTALGFSYSYCLFSSFIMSFCNFSSGGWKLYFRGNHSGDRNNIAAKRFRTCRGGCFKSSR